MSKIHHTPRGDKQEFSPAHKDHHYWATARWVDEPSGPCLCPRHRPAADLRLLRMIREIEERELLEAGCPTSEMLAGVRGADGRAARGRRSLTTPEWRDAHVSALEAESPEWEI